MPVKPFSPREFLRARRPERFSDSVTLEIPTLDRSMLEYHLGSLTSRSQETDFEHFARRIAEKEICPNLLPHTGPTGGGDSKVDSETYPVADALSLMWYSGIGREADKERWAFAFSAKAEWPAKVEDDIRKIVATNRGYRQAFFVTNQFVKDSKRAQVEDRLTTKYKKQKLKVRILDRTWLLDKVFGNGHQAIAIEELKLTGLTRPAKRQGPLDLQRQTDLEAIETRIKDASQHKRFGFQFVADCIESAELARGLELPRTDIEGRFVRAERAAKEYGSEHQRLVCAYKWAWTIYWWFEDYQNFSERYSEAEKHAMGSQNPYDLELLSNLWFCLSSIVGEDKLSKSDANIDSRTSALIGELERLKKDENRASASLQAECMQLLVDLKLSSSANPEPIFRQFKSVIQRCTELVGFPLETLAEILTELGRPFGKHPAYDELYETIVKTVEARTGEATAARMLLNRGAQQMDADQPFEAIRTLGRALVHLYKHESRTDLVRALYLCGSAYEDVGLLWAARGTFLTAASIATHEFWTYEAVTPSQGACYRRLKWLELRLGRLPHALAWNEVDRMIASVLVQKGYDLKRYNESNFDFDAVAGILLLKTETWYLKRLCRLPDMLDKIDFPMAAVALRFALGYENEVPEQLVSKEATPEERYKFFTLWRDQPAAADLATAPVLYDGRKVTLHSVILGCEITVEADNSAPCVELAETLLGALESLLATGVVDHLMAREPSFTMNIRKSELAASPFDFEMKERAGRHHVEVTTSVFNPHSMSRESQAAIKEKLFQLLAHIFAHVFLTDESDKALLKLFKDELALERSINFTSTFIVLGNVLGHNPKTSIDRWIDNKMREYPLMRTEEWDAAERRSNRDIGTRRTQADQSVRVGETPEENKKKQPKHADIKVVSPIRELLWNRAGWFATAYFLHPQDSVPPILAPTFRDAKTAAEIFANLCKDLGRRDEREQLRITLIRGVDARKPNAYRIVIGVNPAFVFLQSDVRVAALMSRINTMEPDSDFNLRSFLAKYNQTRSYFLAHAVADSAGEPQLVTTNAIFKRELHVRDAWQIARNDTDVVGLREDDNPVIPDGERSVPVLETLEFLKRQKLTRSGGGSAASSV